MDKLTGMRVFARVAQAGSFAKAAEQLGMSRAMVTKHVMSLENHLGIRLLNRTTRRLSLTEVGVAYRDRCTQILAEIEEAELAAGQLQTQPRGMLRVTAPTSFGIFHLAPAVADYMRVFPDVEVSLTLNDRILDLADEALDLSIRISVLKDSSLVAQKIAHARTAVCGSPDYLQRHGVPKHPSELVNHNCLRYVYRARDEWDFHGPQGPLTVPVYGTLESTVGDALRLAAINGAGLVFQPTYMVGEDLINGRLQAVLTEYEPQSVDIYAVYLHRKHLSAKVRTFVDFLKARYSPNPYWDEWDRMATPSGANRSAADRKRSV